MRGAVVSAPAQVCLRGANPVSSSLNYTILRPTMIYGTSRDRKMCRLIRYLARWSVLPVIGIGEHLQQPVYVADVAAAVLQAIESAATIGRAYNLSGGTVLTFNKVVDTPSCLAGGFVGCISRCGWRPGC